ncbi:MAG TPA: dihydrouridine synthase, partial [Prolixibacteraceae bacterium]|nr:dihydrouridine synthase [Prolixibacteraceae bacterium]
MDNPSTHQIYLAPLQGFTDFIYRRTQAEIFGHIDNYFCPYISVGKQQQIRNSQLKDVLPENNQGIHVVPQVLFSDGNEFRELCKLLEGFGYREINLNLGCPYPMVTNRGRGSALLQKPETIGEILDIAFSEFQLNFSVKLRSGLESEDEIFPVIETINRFPVSEVIYHPRIARQMYKGEVNITLFQKIKEISKSPLVFNGDILSENDIQKVQGLVAGQTQWMIGRGVLKDPFLPLILKGENPDPGKRREMLFAFHEKIIAAYAVKLEGSSHLLQKMQAFWEYFSESFTNPHKVFKLIKKAGTIEKYEMAVKTIFTG